jgi:hypothetical protein
MADRLERELGCLRRPPETVVRLLSGLAADARAKAARYRTRLSA